MRDRRRLPARLSRARPRHFPRRPETTCGRTRTNADVDASAAAAPADTAEPQSSVYFFALPRAFSTGYFAAFFASFASIAVARSMPLMLANSSA